jgi:DNA-binding IclR family transcriptional regulator
MNEAAGAVKSATRVLDLLEMLASVPDQIGVSEVARRLGIPKSSTYMLLATLESRGYVIGDEERRFQLNPIFGEGRSWVGGSGALLMRLAKVPMEELARATGESSFLGVPRDESSVEYIAKVVSPHDLRCDAELGRPRPLHSTSVGLVMLAFQPPERAENFLRKARFERVTPRTLADAKQLRAEIAATRKRGYAMVRDTNSPGSSGIAAPIVNAAGEVVAALNVSAPTSRFEPVARKAIDLMRAAESISRRLAGTSSNISPARKAS